MGTVSSSSAHLQIWKAMLFCMKNGNKIQKKSEKKIGMVGDDVERTPFSGSNVHIQI